MINDFTTAKDLLDKTQAFADLAGYRLAIQGAPFDPLPDEIYLKEYFLSNTTEPLGIAADVAERQDSIYQINILTPKSSGKFAGLAISNDIKTEFQRGSYISYGGQSAIVYNITAQMLPATDTHNVTSVQIDLTVMASC